MSSPSQKTKAKPTKKRKTARKRRGRGEGSVFERGDGQWTGSINLGLTGEGRRKRKTVYGASKQEVLDELDKLRGDLKAGTLPESGKLTVGQFMTRWLEASRAGLALSTFEAREISVKTHVVPRLGAVALAKLTPLHVESFYSEMTAEKVGPSAARAAAVALSAALKHAVTLKLIPGSPAAGVKKPKPPAREMLFLTGPQAQALLAAAGSPCFSLLALALGSGCRQGELLALAWADLDLKKGTLRVRKSLSQPNAHGFTLKDPKSKSGLRTVSLPPFAVDAMEAQRSAQLKAGLIKYPVFCTAGGGYLGKRNVIRALKAVIERVNDPHKPRKGGRPKKDAPPPPARERLSVVPDGLRFHDPRHTVASLLLSQGQSLKAVSQRLGHRDPAVTLRVYAHCMPGDDGQLADGLQRLIG